MGRIHAFAGPELRARLYAEGAALPYRGLSVLGDTLFAAGIHLLEIITDKLPSGYHGQHDIFIDGDEIRFKRDSDC